MRSDVEACTKLFAPKILAGLPRGPPARLANSIHPPSCGSLCRDDNGLVLRTSRSRAISLLLAASPRVPRRTDRGRLLLLICLVSLRLPSVALALAKLLFLLAEAGGGPATAFGAAGLIGPVVPEPTAVLGPLLAAAVEGPEGCFVPKYGARNLLLFAAAVAEAVAAIVVAAVVADAIVAAAPAALAVVLGLVFAPKVLEFVRLTLSATAVAAAAAVAGPATGTLAPLAKGTLVLLAFELVVLALLDVAPGPAMGTLAPGRYICWLGPPGSPSWGHWA